MCGVIGIVSKKKENKIKDVLLKSEFQSIISHAERRGQDSSGIIYQSNEKINIKKADWPLSQLASYNSIGKSRFTFGHSRLITNGSKDNQPVTTTDTYVIHNGIIVNSDEIFNDEGLNRDLEIDSEVIVKLYEKYRSEGLGATEAADLILEKCKGTASVILIDRLRNELILFSNNGSLYYIDDDKKLIIASEAYPLKSFQINGNVNKIYAAVVIQLNQYNIDLNALNENIDESHDRNLDLIPSLGVLDGKEKLLVYQEDNGLRRCTKCVLPETMPFIEFDDQGVCNYCNHYVKRNVPKPLSILEDLVEKYRRIDGKDDCIIPFSGGRDSCMGLHIAVKELGLKPITYTYDWGMVTDLARRNISRMCSELGVENIIVADNIQWKRENVRKNVRAWLKYPDLGMVNIFTAGDKHFFRHVEDVKKQTGINLNLWSVNPMEVTHFKAGFMGIEPNLSEENVYTSGWKKQLQYQKKRYSRMLRSPGYFNRSIVDNFIGEYYRSFYKKTDYYHLFDYYTWDENEIDDVLINRYDFEKAPDTTTTWRIGDGTAAFYNYIYYTLAGFSEHDTFRSNQIREGQISREKALELIKIENRPRYQNIAWYLQAINLDFTETINTINKAKKVF